MPLWDEGPIAASAQRGVLYFNTIPRDMRPQEIRLHFNRYGDIRRMKFVPFPKKARRPGGSLLPLQYKEGWMEFGAATDAREAALCMNGQPVDVKRQRRCYGQLWTVRFMENFTWDSLLEEAEGKRRARRAAEVEARQEERAMNEAYRRMVMQAEQQRRTKRRPRGEVVLSNEGDESKSEPRNEEDADVRTTEVRAHSGTVAVAHRSSRLKSVKPIKKSDAPPVKKRKLGTQP